MIAAAMSWPVWLAIALAAAAVVAAIACWPRFAAWSVDRRQCFELARGSGLDVSEAAVAWRLARCVSPRLPLAVFVRPSLWDLAVARIGAEANAVAAIRGKLFG